MNERMIRFYTEHGRMSDPGRHSQLYEGLPHDVVSLVETVQGLLLHRCLSRFHGVGEAEATARKQEEQYSTVEDMLSLIRDLDASPLTKPREPNCKLLVNCRHFAGLCCSFLRHAGVPARVRAGFAKYFMPPDSPMYQSHYVTEYWDAKTDAWMGVDSQVDAVQRRIDQITIDTLHLSPNAFLSGGQTWRLCRSGEESAEHFGLGPDVNGWGFVRSHLLHDWMALNGVPLLPWHGNEFMHKGDGTDCSEIEYALLDRAADLICRGDKGFADMRSLCSSSAELSMPEDWLPPVPVASE